jgi:hypothetical protein
MCLEVWGGMFNQIGTRDRQTAFRSDLSAAYWAEKDHFSLRRGAKGGRIIVRIWVSL